MTENDHKQQAPEAVAKGHGAEQPRVPSDLMTESELIDYLRIPELSKAKDHHNVIENLKRMREFPRLHLCNGVVYPVSAVRKWIEENTEEGGK